MPAFAQRVLDLVDAIPPGKVLAYGDIAEYLGEGGPRQVGSVMSTWGGAVPWHRVVHADGTPAPSHDGEVLRLLRADVTPMRGDRRRHAPGPLDPRLLTPLAVSAFRGEMPW